MTILMWLGLWVVLSFPLGMLVGRVIETPDEGDEGWNDSAMGVNTPSITGLCVIADADSVVL